MGTGSIFDFLKGGLSHFAKGVWRLFCISKKDARPLPFVCKKCGSCCRQPGFVYLKSGEAERIAQSLGAGLYDFTDKYCEVLEKRHLVLKKCADETCVFLSGSDCAIYGARPDQCRDFPGKWKTPASRNYCEGAKAI